MAKSPKHEPEDLPPKPESGANEPKAGSLEARVARLEHQLNVLAPLAELLPMVIQIRRQFGGV